MNCGAAYDAGLRGFFTDEWCASLQADMPDSCGCEGLAAAPGAAPPSSATNGRVELLRLSQTMLLLSMMALTISLFFP